MSCDHKFNYKVDTQLGNFLLFRICNKCDLYEMFRVESGIKRLELDLEKEWKERLEYGNFSQRRQGQGKNL